MELTMKSLQPAVLTITLCLTTTLGLAQGFPAAPANLKEAQAQGLVRVTADELRTFFPGSIELRGPTGQHLMIYKADGSIDRKGIRDKQGIWRIDAGRNAYCNTFQRRGDAPAEACFAVYRAPDGLHFFDYDLRDGFYAHVWRKASAE